MNSSSICMAISASSSNTSFNQCLNPFLGKLLPSKPNQNLRRTACVRVNTKALLSSSKQAVLNDFHERRALKIISGLQNFDRENVASVVTAADKGGATHVDIACDPDLVRLAIGLTSLPVCVSSVDPAAFSAAVEAGALMVEIGNYDSFYEAGVIFSPEQILKLTKETRGNLPSITLSVTVPHTLSLPDQVKLAEMLEKEGVDVIQTEGGKCSTPSKSGVLGLIEKGVGSAVNKLNDVIAMVAEVRSIAESLKMAAADQQITHTDRSFMM
ncbi:hypothetical protein ES288_D06G252800v1 [Gossypium darwinii]|uniref:Uncharacterized protein ycf23 n=1 Tax=Gossypium darwinii TaxID=34276 RepID=A0A5D2C9S8_GOSDA|nr:hypothetical protein ES288_D06G252800v1 [Gossypium darwinii]